MKNNRILILGSREEFSLEKMYQRAFKRIGLKVNFFHIYYIRKKKLDKFIWKFFRIIIFYLIRQKIIRYLEKNKKTFKLIFIFKGIYINEKFILKIKNISNKIKIINILPDNPFDIDYFKDISNQNILKSIKHFDHVFIYSRTILDKLKKTYPRNKFSYLPFAHDDKIHKNLTTINNNEIDFDLSFVGTADEVRYKIIKELKEFRIILAGDGWDKFDLSKNITYVKKVNAKNFSKLINRSKLSLNILRKQNEKSHNMKTFEIPAMGGLMITKRNLEQNFFFPENKASLMYGNIQELKLKINKIKTVSKKFKKIQEKSFNISKKHSYYERAKYLLKKIYE
jgi:spore maturation protein CgeB